MGEHGDSEKKGRDWLELLVVPVSLTLLGAFFTLSSQNSQTQIAEDNRKQDLQIADNKQRDEVLKNYLDSMKALLLDKDHPLHTDQESQHIARTLTLTSLKQLTNAQKKSEQKADEQKKSEQKVNTYDDRKGLVVRFLLESQLIQSSSSGKTPIIKLEPANLSYADLEHADLTHANLRGVDMSHTLIHGFLKEANLSNTTFREADLIKADFTRANLKEADFTKANLKEANLTNADLTNADLTNADLSGAILLGLDLRTTIGLTQAQLEGSTPPLMCNVSLPKTIQIKTDRDCKRVP